MLKIGKSQPEKRKQFYRQLKGIVRPELAKHDLLFDKKRSFHREVVHDGFTFIQIIEFQLGTKSMVGQFTVNLGIFSPKHLMPHQIKECITLPCCGDCLRGLNKRLGFFVEPTPSLLQRLLGKKQQPNDYWWPQSSNPKKMAATICHVITCLNNKGLPWIELRSCKAACDWALDELERAKKWKANFGKPGCKEPFDFRNYDGTPQSRA